MDISDRHFHIASITPQGVILYESEFEFAAHSVDAFISLVESVYANQGIHDSLDRDMLLDAAVSEEGASVTLGLITSQFRLIWLTCDNACANSSKPERN